MAENQPRTNTQTLNQVVTIKLSENNYLVWRQQVVAAIYGYGLESYISKEGVKPIESDPSFTSWKRQDQLLTSWLLSSLTEPILVSTVGLNSSQEIWEALETSFATQSRAKIMQYRLQLQTTRKKDQPMREYLNKIKLCCDMLGAAGHKLSDEEQISYILSGLGSEYNSVMVSVNSRLEPYTLREVHALLLSFESRLESLDLSSSQFESEGSSAFLHTIQNSSFNGAKRGSYRGRGGPRGRSGRGYRGRGGRFGGNRVYCQICHKTNHTADKCFHRTNLNYSPNNNGSSYSSNGSINISQYQNDPSVNLTGGSSSSIREISHDNCWFPDSGATNHVTYDLGNLSLASEYSGSEKVQVGNGTGLNISHHGLSKFMFNHDKSYCFNLKNLLHVPHITKNLISVSQFCKDNDVYFEFHPNFCLVKDPVTKRILLKGNVKDGLYRFSLSSSVQDHVLHSHQITKDGPRLSASLLENNRCQDVFLWHKRLGHASFDVLRRIQSNYNVVFDHNKAFPVCTPCQQAKSHRLPFLNSNTDHYDILELIYTDLWGPAPITSRNGFKYYISFVDHKTRFTWLYLLKAKSEAAVTFIKFKNLVENLVGKRIKILQSDGGSEFKPLAKYLSEHGILHRMSCPYTPQQNGLVERKHRHIVETGLSLLATASMPKSFWEDAFITSVYIINRLPSKVLKFTTPLEALRTVKPDYKMLKVFGCLCFPYLRPYNSNKLEYRSQPSTFLGYHDQYKGYKVLLPSGKTILSRHVIFNELEFPFKNNFSQSNKDATQHEWSSAPFPVISHSIPDSQHPNNTTTSDHHGQSPILSSSSSKQSTYSPIPISPDQTFHGGNIIIDLPLEGVPTVSNNTDDNIESVAGTHHMATRSKTGHSRPKKFAFNVGTELEPQSYQEALLIPQWKEAMTKEFAALKNNKTWTLVPHPKDRDVIQCKWIFKIKKNVDGSISRYKARLVAKGFTQIAGLDYTETYSPVVKPTTVRIILSLAISNSWTMRQLDIDNAFLNGELTEELYMSQVPGFEEYDNTGAQLVCKLKKSLYGLKQASRAWNSKLSSVLCNLGFKSSAADSSLYYRRNGDCNIFILTYVDDIIITGSSSVEINTVIDSLSKNFPLKDLGQLHYFLGIEISQTSSGAFLNQSSYITEILKQTNMIEAKPVASPMVINHQLSKINGKPMENGTNYRKVIGALQYATISRPDISFSVNKLSQYMQNPLDNHWKALKRVLRYLAGSIDFGLHFYSDSSLHLSGFADADWGSDVDDRRSTSGYCVFMGKNLVSWSSKKQGIVSRSSSEAEYRSVAAVTCELVWIQNLLSELGIKVPKPSIIWNDNTSAVSLSSNPVFHSRTKHLELDLHFIRDKIKEGIVSVRYVPGLHQVADILTKPLTGQFFARFRNKLNITSKRAIELRGAEKVKTKC